MTRELSPDGIEEALARLRSESGKSYWRGLEELFDHAAFRQQIAAEFPALARLSGNMKRRDFMKYLAGTLAVAGLTGCEHEPDEEALPYVRTPEGATPGEPRYYATAVELDGIGQPVIGKCRDGRPIKLEGNPDHPASGGATDAFTQAELIGLYDPDRSASPRQGGHDVTWDGFQVVALDRLGPNSGEGFRLLTGPVQSPTLLRQIAEMRARWPSMRWHVHAPLGSYFGETGKAASGRSVERRLRLDRAHAIVALDDDLLGSGPFQTWHARGWSARRRAYQNGDGSALLFTAEPSPTVTGATATERLVASQGRMGALLIALGSELGLEAGSVPALNSREAEWVKRAAGALARNRTKGILSIGMHHAPHLQQLALAINDRLGNLGETLELVEPATGEDPPGTLVDLVGEMNAGDVSTLFILDSNPAYSAPPDLGFETALASVALRIHAGRYRDETAKLCHWHLPLAHALESWSDVRTADGSASISQPLVRPWLDVRSRHEVLALLSGEASDGRAIVRETWLKRWGGDENRWQDTLVKGLVADTAPTAAPAAAPAVPEIPAQTPDRTAESIAANEVDIIFRADPTVHDGCHAGNAWLQETPKPLTKLTWDNAVHVSPALAQALDLKNEDVVELRAGNDRIRGAIWIVPGQERRTVLVHLGYGRRAGGRLAEGNGFDAYRLRSRGGMWSRRGTLLRTGEHYKLASTQTHNSMEGHDFVRTVEAAGARLPEEPPKPNFYPPQEKTRPSWGMAIDLDLCIGCNACMTACVAENNIPSVGKEQVAKGREMHWIRVDRYHEGSPDDPSHVFQPVPCMHCENAPCEMGCPVNATVHSKDGLNVQVYNRCIGTRTCSAYCPYKVRRFNWFDYTKGDPPETKAMRNPEVTVRDRGVMEKCTYCIQRIEETKIKAELEGRALSEGEVKTACQQACPTQAIMFGDISREESAVSRRKASGRDYALIEEANTRPRTTYGARIESGEGMA